MTSRILKITALLFFAATLFVACDKEATTDSFGEIETQEAFMQMEEAGHLGCNGCFQLVFPVTLVFEDGTTAAVDSRIAIRQAIRAWIQDNGRPTQRPQFAYPFGVTLRDGTVQTIASDEDLRELVQGCRPNGPHDRTPCYDLVFPVTLVYPDGTEAEAAGPMALRQLLRQWKQDNPDSDERPTLGFPIQVTLSANDSLVTVNSQEELMALREDCAAGNFGPCFTINYPVTIALPDGTTAEADSPQAARQIFQDWRENNPGPPTAGERPGFVFPIEVTLTEDDSVVSVESPEELRALWNDCH
jgi:hypothetical protein